MVKRQFEDDSSDNRDAPLFRKKLLKVRNAPFGIRAFAWYAPDSGDIVGSEGGAPGFTIEPAAVQDDGCGGSTPRSKLGGTQLAGMNPELFVNGGVIWIPFAATVYWDWPDRSDRNNGKMSYSIESWDAEFGLSGSNGMCYTRLLIDGQSISVPQTARTAVCNNPFAALELPGATPIRFQTGQTAAWLGGAVSVTMRFLPGMPAGVNAVPVTFYYV